MKLNILHFVDNAQVSTLEVEGTVKSSIASINSSELIAFSPYTANKQSRVQWTRDGVKKEYVVAKVLKQKLDATRAPFYYEVQLG